MKRLDLVELTLLGAVWGSSFLFMRLAAPEFGPVPLIAIRVTIAAGFLTAVLAWRGGLRGLWARAGALTLLGAMNSALPFSLFAYATLTLTAGFASVLNATAPLFGVLVAYLWFRERPGPRRALGLLVGFVGVVVLVWSKLALLGDRSAVLAALLAATGYGLSAHFTKRKLPGVEPLAIAAGSQLGASLLLFVPAVALWPARAPSASSWLCALALGVLCTGIAYVLYFRLIARIGPTRAITVTYLIPAFGVLWGAMFLGEQMRASTLVGCVVILIGTTLVTRAPATVPSVAKRPQATGALHGSTIAALPTTLDTATSSTPCPSSPTKTVR